MDEAYLRQRIFSALEDRLAGSAGVLTSTELAFFDVDGQPRRLIANSKGIWNPQDLSATLSVVSSADGPYADEELAPGIWRYDYEAGSTHGSNTKSRRAFESGVPIILLRKIAVGVYVPHFPVFVVDDHPEQRYFTLAVQDAAMLKDVDDPDVRRCVERVVKQRVHQPEFRGKVLLAYDNQCAVCLLRHPELLDAAQILPDSHPEGRAVVTNGLSLCKIHHGAYDADSWASILTTESTSTAGCSKSEMARCCDTVSRRCMAYQYSLPNEETNGRIASIWTRAFRHSC